MAGFEVLTPPRPEIELLVSVPPVPESDVCILPIRFRVRESKERPGPHCTRTARGVFRVPEIHWRVVARLPPLTRAAFLDSGLNSGYYHTNGIPTGNPHLLNIRPAHFLKVFLCPLSYSDRRKA